MLNTKKRVDWIDIAKGLGMFLVIIGHSNDIQIVKGNTAFSIIIAVIFSFHMPLFFILSTTPWNYSVTGDEYIEKTRKAFLHLILSAIGIYLINIVFQITKDFTYLVSLSLIEIKKYISNIINVFVVGSGAITTIGDTKINALGIPWFLLVLFFGRSLFDYLHFIFNKRQFYIAIVICSIIGIGFGKVQWLPFSFDIALAIQPLFLFGQWIKYYDMKNKTTQTMIISFVVWFLLFLFLYVPKNRFLELAVRSYPFFPICYICAIAGTIFISSFSQLLSKYEKICNPIKYLGKNSLVMIWIHSLDMNFSFIWSFTSNIIFAIVLRVFFNLVLFTIIMPILEYYRRGK